MKSSGARSTARCNGLGVGTLEREDDLVPRIGIDSGKQIGRHLTAVLVGQVPGDAERA